MRKTLVAGLTALLVSTVFAHAQSARTAGPAPRGPSAEELKAASDARIEITKIALQLTPEQEKLWPAVEEAMRARAAMRHQRLITAAAALSDDREQDPFDLLRKRSDALAQRAATLRKLVDAWQPLYNTLDARQKLRLRFVTTYSLREAMDAVSSRLDELEDSGEW